jgi:hypothetical protein
VLGAGNLRNRSLQQRVKVDEVHEHGQQQIRQKCRNQQPAPARRTEYCHVTSAVEILSAAAVAAQGSRADV